MTSKAQPMPTPSRLSRPNRARSTRSHRAGVLAWSIALLPLVTIFFAGCGGCGKQDPTARASSAQLAAMKQRAAERAKADEKANAEVKLRKEEAKSAKAKQRSAQREKINQPPAPVAPPKPARPENLADWKAEHYLSAREDNDPRLIDAVGQVSSTTAAEVLPVLLGRAEGKKAKPDRNLLRAVIVALARQPGELRAVLEGILWGRIATDDDKCALDCTLEVLFASPDQHAETLALQILRQRARGEDSPNEIAHKKRVLAAVANTGSNSFRLELARMALAAETAAPLRSEYLRVLCEPRVENLPAQLALYRDPALSPAVHAILERIFSDCALRALALAAGLPPPSTGEAKTSAHSRRQAGRARDAEPGTSPEARTHALHGAPDLIAQAATGLWTGAFQDVMGQRLFRLESLDRQTGLFTLVSSFPTDAMRAQVQQALSRNWQDGAESLQAASAGCEPGFLVVVKTLPRRGAAWSPAAPRISPDRNGNSRTPRDIAQVSEAKQEIDRVGGDWFRFSHNLSRSLIQRLEAASRNSVPASPGTRDPDAAHECPIDLHPDARVVARCRILWPEAFPQADGFRPDGLEVHYIRIHETTRHVKAIVAHYRRRLKAPLEEVADNGRTLWLDSVGPGRDDDRLRSVDVIISKSKAVAFATPNEEEKIAVDLLTVEIRKPGATRVARSDALY